MKFNKTIIKKFKNYTFLFAAIVIVGLAVKVGIVLAVNSFGCNNYEGYFNNCKITDAYGDYVISDGIQADTASEFISEIKNYLHNGSAQNKTGAAFIVLTMLKVGSETPYSTKAEAINRFDEWADKIRYYNHRGWIDFNKSYTYYYNTYWQGNGAGSNPNDDAGYREAGTANSIVFYNPDGSKYVIKRRCANPVGGLRSLIVQWNLNSKSLIDGQQTVYAAPGTKHIFTHDIWNAKTSKSRTYDFSSTVKWTSSPTGVNQIVNWTNNPDSGSNMPNTIDHTAKSRGDHISVRTNEFVVPTTATKDQRYCQNIRYTKAVFPGLNAEESTEACVIVSTSPPPPGAGDYTPKIQAGSYEKGSSDANQRKITVTISVPIGAVCGADTVTWHLSGFGLASTDTASKTSHFTASTCASADNTYFATVDATVLNNSSVGPINYTVTIDSINGTAQTNKSASDSLIVYEVPYSRFYGNDVHATNGAVFFNSKNNTTGSASQYAAIAKSFINFVTATFRSDDPVPPSGLSVASFANINSLAKERDMVEYLPTISNLCNAGSTNLTIQGSSTEGYCGVTGNLTISSNGQSQKKVTAHADNIYISSNIIAQDIPTGNKFDDSAAPVILLIADSNIYIDPDVTQIDAILIANDIIYTCANNSPNSPAREDWATQCNKKLIINGAIGASNIKFQRSIGTRLLGASGENSNDLTSGNIKNTGGDYNGSLNHAAEVINYPGYLYFATPYLKDDGKAGFQAIFNAPPLF